MASKARFCAGIAATTTKNQLNKTNQTNRLSTVISLFDSPDRRRTQAGDAGAPASPPALRYDERNREREGG